jgi:hypothetical protein
VRLRRSRTAGLALATLLVGACSQSPCYHGMPAEFVSLGKNPFAITQPTDLGRRLHTLAGWRGEIFMGYGDYNENTGPIEVSAYNPRRRSFSTKLRFPTEAIEVYRVIGDHMYAPAIDPVGKGPSAAVAVGEPEGRWWNNRSVFVTHAFDIATFDGTDLWLVGSRETSAIALRSTDGGGTWTVALQIGPRSGNEEDFARFYFVFVQGGRLYVQAEDYLGGRFPLSKVFNDGVWTDGPDLLPIPGAGAKPHPIAGKVAYLGAHSVLAFDRGTVQHVYVARTEMLDLTSADGVLYALDGREVLGTRDLTNWVPVATTPDNTTSIGILDGALYAGTADSELFRYCWPIPSLLR